jgi:DNA topoisomerase VI subunit B
MINSHFLRDLTHQHDWLFGALAELVHNSRDAHAKTCRISVQRLGAAQKPHLIVEDDGSGMTHTELRHAFSFGRVAGRTREDACIGRYNFGLKHVRASLTQTTVAHVRK